MSDTAPLRVTAVAASAQLGGTERVLLDFAARAFEHDIALRVITPRDGPLLRVLNELGVPTEVVRGPARMLRGSQRAGALTTIPAALAGLALWGRRLQRHPLIIDADILYVVAFKPYLATARHRRSPIVWHLHEFPPAFTGPIWQALGRRVPRRVVANSAAVGSAWNVGARLSVVPNGVDLDRFRPAERTSWIHDELGIPRDGMLIGMPAVLARWKGQLLVLDAFCRMAERHPRTHLLLIGSAIYDTAAERTYEADLAQAIRHVPEALAGRVHRLPFQTKVERVYPELDLCVHYSTRPEAFGRVILEAMASGVPVCAAAEGGPTEIVTDGGWLVEPRNPGALAEALSTACALPASELRAVGTWGRVRAEDHFSARRFARDVARALRAAR